MPTFIIINEWSVNHFVMVAERKHHIHSYRIILPLTTKKNQELRYKNRSSPHASFIQMPGIKQILLTKNDSWVFMRVLVLL